MHSLLQILTFFLSLLSAKAEAACPVPRPPGTFCVSDFAFGDRWLTDIMKNVFVVLMSTAPWVLAAIFIAGAFFFIASAGVEQWKNLGKQMMVGAVIGTVVIAGANIIMNIVLYMVKL
ncbi:MAG: hypothetical protein V1926_05850 [Candidatus Peregrinibacteria bacterium]